MMNSVMELPESLHIILHDWLGGVAEQSGPAGQGGNSHLHCFRRGMRAAVLKIYSDGRQRGRGQQEFSALSFLARAGLPVPLPLALSSDQGMALYSWLEGETASLKPDPADADRLADFWMKLQSLRDDPLAEDLVPASAACFSLQDALDQASHRLARLEQALTGSSPVPDLQQDVADFVRRELSPALRKMQGSLPEQFHAAGLEPSARLERRWQVLSPSDFGRHNSLRRPDGGLSFVDFEYFGWDDPAKAVSDMMLHPGSAFTPAEKKRLLARFSASLAASDPAFPLRQRLLYPLFGMIWCLIILNLFLPEQSGRLTEEQGQTRLRRAASLLQTLSVH